MSVGASPGGHAPNKRLIEQIFDIAIGHALAVDLGTARAVEPQPLEYSAAPFARHLRQQREASAGVFSALGIVRGGRHHRARPLPGALLRQVVKSRDRHAEAPRVAADFVERQQPDVAVEGGVLGGLGHDRAGDLLKMHRSVQWTAGGGVTLGVRCVAGQDAAEKIEDADIAAAPAFASLPERPVDIAAIVGAGAAWRYVGAVDRERRDDLLERCQHCVECEVAGAPIAHCQKVELPREHVHFAGEVDLHDALLAGVEHFVEGLVARGKAAVEAGCRSLALGVDEDRQHLVDKIVSGSSGDRPIWQHLVPREDLFDQHVDRCAGSLLQPARNSPAGQRGRQCGRCAAPAHRRARSARTAGGASPRTARAAPCATRPGR